MITMAALAGDLPPATVAELLAAVNGAEAGARLSATRELFLRGPSIVGQLESAGALAMGTLSPPRGDVVYSLLKGELSTANAAPATFGLHVEAGTSMQDVERMGRAHGFRLLPAAVCRPNQSPSCYVQLVPGRRLADVLRDILTTEAQVRTVNLNQVER